MIDLKSLKNDDMRISFLEDYRNVDNGWYLWKEDTDMDRRFWRLDLEDGPALIVEEHKRTICYYTEPKHRITWLIQQWYVVKDWNRPFDDNSGSRTMALKKIKEVAKRND